MNVSKITATWPPTSENMQCLTYWRSCLSWLGHSGGNRSSSGSSSAMDSAVQRTEPRSHSKAIGDSTALSAAVQAGVTTVEMHSMGTYKYGVVYLVYVPGMNKVPLRDVVDLKSRGSRRSKRVKQAFVRTCMRLARFPAGVVPLLQHAAVAPLLHCADEIQRKCGLQLFLVVFRMAHPFIQDGAPT